MNFIKQLKRMSIPPCSACKWNRVNESTEESTCINPKGLDLLEKLSGRVREESMPTTRMRAGKYCNFEPKHGE